MNALRGNGGRSLRPLCVWLGRIQPRNSSYPVCRIQNVGLATRRFSAAAAADAKGANKETPKKNDSNIFLDNIGTVFLVTIGLIIGSLVRASYGTSNKHKIRDDLELDAALDPYEIDDMREANMELNPDVFRKITENVKKDFPHGTATYHDFVQSVRRTMVGVYGNAFTIEFGHLLDRVVVEALRKRNKTVEVDEESLVFWLATLSLAMYSSVSDRIRILYEVLELRTGTATFANVVELVHALQDTCQLVMDTQVIPTNVKFPTQQYKQATPEELVLELFDGTTNDPVDIEGLATILRSKSVCAWGECYLKKKPPV